MKNPLIKFIVNYWGDIFFLVMFPLVYDYRFGWLYGDNLRALHFLIVYLVFTSIALVWVAYFRKKRSRVLRDIQYPLCGLLFALYMLVFLLHSHSFFLFDSAERLTIALFLARIGFWFNKRHQAKKAEANHD